MLAWDVCFYLPSPGISGMCLFMGLGNRRKGAGQDLPSCTSLSAVGPLCIPLCPPGSCQLSSLGVSKLLRVPVSSAACSSAGLADFSFLIFNKLIIFFCFSSSRIWVQFVFFTLSFLLPWIVFRIVFQWLNDLDFYYIPRYILLYT